MICPKAKFHNISFWQWLFTKTLEVMIDLRSVLELHVTQSFLLDRIRGILSASRHWEMETALFTKLTNGIQVNYWVICETEDFFSQKWPDPRDQLYGLSLMLDLTDQCTKECNILPLLSAFSMVAKPMRLS